VKLRRSTWIWLGLLGAGALGAVILRHTSVESGCARGLLVMVAWTAALVLLFRVGISAFRAVVRRLTLRLAFSYFLIGIVPIPLIACFLFVGTYLVALQIIATRVHGASEDLARQEATTDRAAPGFTIDAAGKVTSSDVPWIAIDSDASWAKTLKGPRPLIEGERGWLAVPTAGRIALLLLSDPDQTWAHRLSEATGYDVFLEIGSSRTQHEGFAIDVDEKPKPRISIREKGPRADARAAAATPTPAPGQPAGAPAPTKSLLDRKWVAGVYLDPAVATFNRTEKGRAVVVYVGRTSPRALFQQLFAQGVPDVGRVFWAVFAGIAGVLLIVYLVALGSAFTLVGTIARNVNRLTRASEAISRGDFSVRVHSRSKDQIGDLARSFDGMAASIEGLLTETAKKERLEAEIGLARAIQQKLLPGTAAELPGLAVRAQFQPLAEIGGDYYDWGTAPDGRSIVAIGDVSGHGLSTGLLVAIAKAGLWALLESEHAGTPLFVKLNELIHRSTDSRNYMTLAVFAWDPGTGHAQLTNAGQLAPYRISKGVVDTLSLPYFPLGISPRTDFPTKDWNVERGDRLVFLTDGLIEASNPAGEPFGFERLEAVLEAQAQADASAGEIEAAILSAVAAHSAGAPPEDDRTLVIVTLT
jgi:serine phosphatase RsbU (regulator of sigma subunit)